MTTIEVPLRSTALRLIRDFGHIFFVLVVFELFPGQLSKSEVGIFQHKLKSERQVLVLTSFLQLIILSPQLLVVIRAIWQKKM